MIGTPFKQVYFCAPSVSRDVVQETAARLCLAADPAVAWVDVYCHYRGLPSYLRGLHGVKTYRALVPAEHAELIKEIGVELIRARYGRVPRDRRKNRR